MKITAVQILWIAKLFWILYLHFPVKKIAKNMKRRPELKIAKWIFNQISMVLGRPAEYQL